MTMRSPAKAPGKVISNGSSSPSCDVGRGVEHRGQCVVEDEKVVVVARRAERVGPVQREDEAGRALHAVRDHPAAEVVQLAAAASTGMLPFAFLKSPSHTLDVPSLKLPSLPADEK